jgi:3-hydroxyisobutyrate dehydrogenase-like beta-hydroxyacid dehydrogenase
LIVTSVATTTALTDVITQLAATVGAGHVVVETSTMPLSQKVWARDLISPTGAAVIDCPISGTGAQALARDLVFLASGEPDAIARITPVLERLGRAVHNLGDFGAGSKMKYVANLLVAIHNVATAEAMVLAEKSGLDLSQVYDVLYESAATSRIFQLRAPMMVRNRYEPATAKVSMFCKDLDIISDYAGSLDCPTPLLTTVRPVYEAAMAQGMADADAAVVCTILEQMAGVKRS